MTKRTTGLHLFISKKNEQGDQKARQKKSNKKMEKEKRPGGKSF